MGGALLLGGVLLAVRGVAGATGARRPADLAGAVAGGAGVLLALVGLARLIGP